MNACILVKKKPQIKLYIIFLLTLLPEIYPFERGTILQVNQRSSFIIIELLNYKKQAVQIQVCIPSVQDTCKHSFFEFGISIITSVKSSEIIKYRKHKIILHLIHLLQRTLITLTLSQKGKHKSCFNFIRRKGHEFCIRGCLNQLNGNKRCRHIQTYLFFKKFYLGYYYN